MKIGELLSRNIGQVVSIGPKKSVADGARVISSNYIGALPVNAETGEMLGVLSERDIAVAVALYSRELETVTVDDVMTGKVVSCSVDDSVSDVLDLMKRHEIRHVPVIDGGEVIAMASLRDIMRIARVDLEPAAA